MPLLSPPRTPRPRSSACASPTSTASRDLRRHDARGPGRCRGRPAGAIQSAVASLGLPVELSFETVRRGGFRATYAKVDRPARARPSPPAPHRGDDRQGGASRPARTSWPSGSSASSARPRPRSTGSTSRRSTSTRSARSTRSSTSSARPSGSTCWASTGSRPARSRPAGAGSRRRTAGCRCRRPATAELLKGVPLAESTVEMELTTPTGAAILTTVAEAFGPLPADDHRGDRPRGRHEGPARAGEHPPPLRRHGRPAAPAATASGSWRRTSTTCPARSSATRRRCSWRPGRSTPSSRRSR